MQGERRQDLRQQRQQMRDLQAKQRQELRGRNLNRAEREKLRTQHREQLQNLRNTQRDQLRERRDSARDQERGRERRAANRANVARAQAVENNRFSARYRDRDRDRWRDRDHWRDRERWRHRPPREAWRHGYRPHFVAWIGPLFYPYAYADIFDYTFWPNAYDDGYWAYMYDDFFDGVFWGRSNPYYADQGGPVGETTGSAPARGSAIAPAQVAKLCRAPGEGVTAWPIARIEQNVKPNETQRALLDDLKKAAGDAAAAFKEACIEEIPLTPPGRLAAMTSRLEATLQAVRIVRPPLDAFYNSLDDEQKARFNAIGPERLEAQDEAQDRARAQDQAAKPEGAKTAEACPDVKPGLVDLPLAEIEETLKPNESQRAALDRLRQATTSAAGQLQAACPGAIPLTPSGRLEAMEKRLDTMVQAAKTLQPALSDFYAALDSEQKAQFNTLGRQARGD